MCGARPSWMMFFVLLVFAFAISGCDIVRDVRYVQATEADQVGDHARAARLYAFVANSESYEGRQAAQLRLSQMYMEGLGVKKDPREGIRLLEETAGGPDKTWRSFALYDLGKHNWDGIPGLLEPNRQRAADYYGKCAAAYDLCKQAFQRISRHPEVYVRLHPENFRHAQQGQAPAGMRFGLNLFKAGKREEAFPIFLWHARNGNASAQATVATYFKEGRAGDKDPDLYKAWAWLAARNGNDRAQFELGLIYREGGDLIPGSDVEAEKWLSAAARQGVVEAVNALGVLKLHPFDTEMEPDHAAALTYFRQAAEAGSANAMANIADMYRNGVGVKTDRELAKKYYIAAAGEGNVLARTRLFEHFDIVFDKKKAKKIEVASLPQPRRTPKATPAPAHRVPEKVAVPIPRKPRTPSPVDLYSRLSPSVMRIFAANVLKEKGGMAQGSAVAVTPHLAVTNCHVIEGMNLYGTKLGDEVVFFRYAAGDKKRDVCIIRAKASLRPVGATRTYEELKVGEKVYAIGSPKGLTNTLSEGIISGLRKKDGVRFIQTSAPIASGSSGGGLFDEHGRLIGITTFRVRGGGNLNFAVAVDEALDILSRVR